MPERKFTFAQLVAEFDVDDEQQMEALYASGLDDATVEDRGNHALVTFYRAAGTPEDALWSAIEDLQKARLECRILRVDDWSTQQISVSRSGGLRRASADTLAPDLVAGANAALA